MSYGLKSVRYGQHLLPLLRFRAMILTFVASATVTALALTYVVSEKYGASAIVLFQPNESVAFQQKSRDALGYPLPLVPLETIANTIEDVAKGEAVLEQTVRTLRLDVPRRKRPDNALMATLVDVKDRIKELRSEAWQILQYGRVLPKDNFRGAMVDLRKNLAVRRTNKAYTFRLEAVSDDPERAALIVNTVADILGDVLTRDRARMDRETKRNLETRLMQAVAEVDLLRTAMDSLKRNTGVAVLEQELSLRLKSVNTFQDELSKARTQIESLEQQRASIASQLEKLSRSEPYTSTVADNPVYLDLLSEEARLEVERSGMLEKFTPAHDEVKAVEAKLARTRERLQKEPRKILTSESSRLSDVHQKLLAEKLALDADVEAARAREQGYAQTVAMQEDLARKLIRTEPKLGDVTLRLSVAEKSYQLVNEAYQEAVLRESKTIRELTLQQPALIPHEPAKPLKIVHVSAAFLTSLALGIGFAIAASFLDTKVRTIADTETALGLPVFGTIPLLPATEAQGLIRRDL